MRTHQNMSWIGAVVALAVCLGLEPVRADVYPSGLKILEISDADPVVGPGETATVRYVLNEDADGDGVNPGVRIRVVLACDPSTAVRTVDIPTQAKGVHTWVWDKTNDLGQPVPDNSYRIEITASDAGYGSWTMISTDTVLNNFELPRGVAVNKNPDSEYYGRVYISNGRSNSTADGRTMADGIYVLNADFSEPAGSGSTGPRTGGEDWTIDGTGGPGPFRLEVGPDDRLYITDWSDGHSGLWVTDPEVAVATEVLDSSSGRSGDGLTSAHGSISDVVVLGLGGGRTIYTLDEDFTGGGPASQTGSVWRYLIGTAPTSASPELFYDDAAAGDINVNFLSSLARASDGTWWISQNRSAGTDVASLWQISEDGTTVLFDSLADLGSPDPLRGTQGMAYDPVNNLIALATGQTGGVIIIFDPTTKSIVTQFNFGATTNTDVAFDAVGNLYVGNRSAEYVRVWSPPTGAHQNTTRTRAFTVSATGVPVGPTITAQPQDAIICPGQNAQFSVTATGSGGLSYQWLRDGVEIPGETGSALTITAPGSVDHGAAFVVRVCDDNGQTTSDVASLLLVSGPTITQQPEAVGVRPGEEASFGVQAVSTASPPGTLHYQWKHEANSIITDVGTDSPVFTIPSAGLDDAGNYWVEVTDTACGGVTSVSTTVVLNVVPLPCNAQWADTDGDLDVDQEDFGQWQLCFGGSGAAYASNSTACECLDRDSDADVDSDDYLEFIACAQSSGPAIPASPYCGATILFQDNFDGGTSAGNWILQRTGSPADSPVDFAFDYSTVGIPSAPGSGGTTTGLKVSVNDVDDAADPEPLEAAIAFSNADFNGDYTLHFDLWLQYGGISTTEHALFGVNGNGGALVAPTIGTATTPGSGPASAGHLFAATGEGGDVRDYRTYEGLTELLALSSGFIGGAQDALESPYAEIFPSPRAAFTGGMGNGDGDGWGWARVEIRQSAGIITVKLNGTVIASRSAGAYASGKVMLGHMDLYSSVNTGQTYVVFDNVAVTMP